MVLLLKDHIDLLDGLLVLDPSARVDSVGFVLAVTVESRQGADLESL